MVSFLLISGSVGELRDEGVSMLSTLEFSEELGDRLLEIAALCSVLSSLRGLAS